MGWAETITVACPTCNKSRTIHRRRPDEITECRSCAASRRKTSNDWNLSHGQSKSALYAVWASMKRRCFSPNQQFFKIYGGRGITVCEEWLKFENFQEWAHANGYEKGKFIDRIDCDGHYEPSNCRWVDRAISDRNKRNTVPEKLRGYIQELYRQGFMRVDIAYVYGLNIQTVCNIVNQAPV